MNQPKKIEVTTLLQTLKADASTCETRAEVVHIIGEYLERATEVQEAGMFSDGYHTFDELYAHRVRLFTCLMHAHRNRAWWSHKHSDGSQMDGWIIAGILTPRGMVTYHLPVTEIEHLPEGIELEEGRLWDGHTAEDVLKRLPSLNFGRTDGTAIEHIPLEEPDELVVYQYAASVNMALGSIHWDGVVTSKLISGIEDYRAVRAEIARDGNVKIPEQIQVHNLAMIGFVPADSNHHTREGAAIKTLDFLGYTYSAGAEHWRPPVGEAPDFDLLDLLAEMEAAAADCPTSFGVTDCEAHDRYVRHLKATQPEIILNVVKALRAQLLHAPKDGE